MSVTGQIGDTQTLLQAIISKPKLTDNLLNKPPFRFLHDIISEVNRATGFCEGLYNDDEKNAGNIKDKEAKVGYLTKIIDMVGIALNEPVPAKPLKIVAGLEAENTNYFLQQLATACKNESIDRESVVSRVLNGEHAPGGGAPAPKKEAAPVEKPKPKPEPAPAPAPAAPSGPSPSELDKRPPTAGASERPKRPSSSRRRPAAEAAQPAATEVQPAQPELDEDGKPKAARPSTARRAPPKVADNVVDAKPVQPPPKAVESKPSGTAGVILDGQQDDDDDLVVESKVAEPFGSTEDTGAIVDDGTHGVLVRKILESEQAVQANAQNAQGGEVINKKDRQKLAEEVSKLRETVQSLCQNTNQLGKCMDYVQEDVENMTKELDFWKSQKNTKTSLLEDQLKQTEVTLEPLQQQIRQLEESLKEQNIKNENVKAAVLKNDVQIRQLLTTAISRT